MTDDIKRPVFICGTGRSGTTLLALMLDSHPKLISGPEIKILQPTADLWWRIQDDLLKFLAPYNYDLNDLNSSFRVLLSSFFNKRNFQGRVVEQTPLNLETMGILSNIFPDAQFIRLIRDGRDVACSLKSQHWDFTGAPYDPTENFTNAATYWVELIRRAKEVARTYLNDATYYEFRYEKLVSEPESEMTKLLEFLGEPYDESVIKYYEYEHTFSTNTKIPQDGIYKSALSRWKKEFTKSDAEMFDTIAGELLIELDYEKDHSWVNF